MLAGKPWADIQADTINKLNKTAGLRIEYFELAHRDDLTMTTDVDLKKAVILIACFVGEVRLIDNMFV